MRNLFHYFFKLDNARAEKEEILAMQKQEFAREKRAMEKQYNMHVKQVCVS